jgi:hypothetical protein
MPRRIAAGFEFQPQPDGTVRVNFHDNDGTIINTQIVTGDAFLRVPLAAFVTTTAMDHAPEVVAQLVRIMRAAEEAEDGS